MKVASESYTEHRRRFNIIYQRYKKHLLLVKSKAFNDRLLLVSTEVLWIFDICRFLVLPAMCWQPRVIILIAIKELPYEATGTFFSFIKITHTLSRLGKGSFCLIQHSYFLWSNLKYC